MSDDSTVRQVVTDHVKRPQTQPDGGASWRTASELPTAEELMRRKSTLYPEPDCPRTKEQYLERQYKMYRHEGIELLRRAVNGYRARKAEDRFSFVYSNARVRGYTFARQGAACRIAFSPKFAVDWFDPDETRLKVGGLVALSNDHFKDQCLVGVVAARPLYGGLIPDLNKGENQFTPPRIDIFWSRSEDSVWDPAVEMVMVEARSAYYEPVRYAMLGLQQAVLTESRFDKYLVDAYQKDPDYETFDKGEKVQPPDSGFDQSQLNAYERMTTKELAIVQGPPGTGKTFTSVVALEGLSLRETSPIIVSAHTNHALDQLLLECMKNRNISVARLGGRTQDEDIEQRTLFNIAKRTSFAKGRRPAHERTRMEKIRCIEEARDVCFPPSLVSAQTFRDHGIISQEQYDSLKEDDWDIAPAVTSNEPRRFPDGIEAGTEDELQQAEDELLPLWMASQTEEDRSHLYKPPENQPDPTTANPPSDDVQPTVDAVDGSDFEEAEGPVHKIATAPEEKDRKLEGQFVALHPGLTGSASVGGTHGVSWWNNKARQLLKTNDDLYQITSDQRGAVYRYLRQQLVERVAEDILRRKLQEYKATCEEIKINQDCRNVYILKKEKIRVIGCTTTGLTKYRGLISALEPRVLLIEEAAETHEPNISSALVPSLEQLILVGDHQQLAPGVKVQDMKDFGLDVSLFERLVRRNVPFAQLEVQRRMAPPIREVVQAFYPRLSDHEIVTKPEERPLVQGVDHRIWWFQHRWPDSRHQTSSINEDEARMVIRLYQYLVQNGLGVNQITILSFYKAQVEKIKSMLSEDKHFCRYPGPPGVEKQQGRKQEQGRRSRKASDWDSVVRTVDGFQGEQNEVIILSAVRSCSSSGFVAVENRAVVALSRAKRGMYVFGNEETLLGDKDGRQTWGKVFDVFVKAAMTGESFPITCARHARVTEIHDPEAWSRCKEGGCDLPCEDVHCQENEHHVCQLLCHPQPKAVCRQRCEKVLPCKHKCAMDCGKPCRCAAGCDEPAIKEKIGLTRTPTRPSCNNVALQVRGGITSSTSPEEIGQASNFRKRICRLDEDEAQPTWSQEVLAPAIRETFKRTMLDINGSRVVAETIRQEHEGILIDVSVPEEEQREEKKEEKKEEKVEEEVEDKDDWLIEL